MRRSDHHSASPKNTLAAASCAAPTQKGDSPAAPKCCAVPLVPHNTPASATKATPWADDDGWCEPEAGKEEAEETDWFMPLWCAGWRWANVEKRLPCDHTRGQQSGSLADAVCYQF